MSWSLDLPICERDTVIDVGNTLLDEGKLVGDRSEEVLAQVSAALVAAEELAMVVQPEGHVKVNLQGHANPGGKPVEGLPNDYISIMIRQP